MLRHKPAGGHAHSHYHWCSLSSLLLLVAAALLYGSLALHSAAQQQHAQSGHHLLPTSLTLADQLRQQGGQHGSWLFQHAAGITAAAHAAATEQQWQKQPWLAQQQGQDGGGDDDVTGMVVVADVPGYEAGPPYTLPKLIHQTVKDKAAMPCEVQEAVQSWVDMNPGYTHVLYDDADLAAFVAARYPQLVGLFGALPSNIERTDAWRYLVLHALGGVYADSDVKCMRPIDEWNAGAGHDATLLVGIAKRNLRTGDTTEFNQFVMAALPGHPVLASMPFVIAANLAAHHLRSKPGAAARGKQLDNQILERTGPKAFTAALRAYAGRVGAAWPVNSTLADQQGGVIFGSVRALPKFALGMGWDTLDHNMTCEQVQEKLRPEALICHQFFGSWKAHPEAQLKDRKLTFGDCGKRHAQQPAAAAATAAGQAQQQQLAGGDAATAAAIGTGDGDDSTASADAELEADSEGAVEVVGGPEGKTGGADNTAAEGDDGTVVTTPVAVSDDTVAYTATALPDTGGEVVSYTTDAADNAAASGSSSQPAGELQRPQPQQPVATQLPGS